MDRQYHAPDADLVTCITHGSHLYGTATETSDHDFKCIYMPKRSDLFLCRAPEVQRFRFGPDGQVWPDNVSMPPGSWEAEHTPIQKFVHDYLRGQAYAVELVYAVIQGEHELHWPRDVYQQLQWTRFQRFCKIIARDFRHRSLAGMVGFAVKQIFDYVHRGERLNRGKAILAAIDELPLVDDTGRKLRLNTGYGTAQVMDHLAQKVDLQLGTTMNKDVEIRTIQLNGREYQEHSQVAHFRESVQSLVKEYGERSTNASLVAVDWKAMSHAVRVYEQVIEVLHTGSIRFPRPNAELLIAIKRGEVPVEEVRDLLRRLDAQAVRDLSLSPLPNSDELRPALEAQLLEFIEESCGRDPNVVYRNRWD
jgi:hypothetical protein